MDLLEYMERRCICGRLRKEHRHYRNAEGQLRVLPVSSPRHCPGFIDELEIEVLESGGRAPLPIGERPVEAREVTSESLDAGELARSHGPKCNCLPCIRIWDYSVACTVCGASPGEDCTGLGERQVVHFQRRMLGLFERKQGRGSMSPLIAELLRDKMHVVGSEPS